ncbi:hypothetical protein F5141DRAFT_1117306, partial [Pisolithus sp. B1]
MESNTDSVRRPYVDVEASLFDRLSREVSRFGDNLTVISVPPEDIKPRRINPQELIRPFTGNDASITGEPKSAQRSSEGTDQCSNGSDDSSVSVTSVSKMPASPRRSSIPPPSLLHRRTSSIRFEAVSKPSNQSLQFVTESLLPLPDTCLEVSDDADATTECSDPSVLDGGGSHQSSKDESLPSVPAGFATVKVSPPQTAFDHSSRPHSVPLLNPRLDVLPNSTLSGTRTISGGTALSLGDTSQKTKRVNLPVPEMDQVAAPLSRSSPAMPAVGADVATAHCLPKGDHPPADDPTVERNSSTLGESSLLRSRSDSDRNIPPASTSCDNSTNVPSLKATNLIAEGQNTLATSTEGVPKQSMGSDNPSSVSLPTLHAAFSAIPGSPAAQKSTLPASVTPTNTTTERADRKQIRKQFLPLIQLLVADRRRGIFRPSRSDVATALMQFDENAYKHGGATSFKHYTTLAEGAGLVILGGVEQGGGGGAWIALHPDWFSEIEKPESEFKRICTSRKIMAGCFQPLVDILVQFHRSGIRPVLRSRVRPMLEPTVYRIAGVDSFKKYVARADKAGFVLRGGDDDDSWIRLHPNLEIPSGCHVPGVTWCVVLV